MPLSGNHLSYPESEYNPTKVVVRNRIHAGWNRPGLCPL